MNINVDSLGWIKLTPALESAEIEAISWLSSGWRLSEAGDGLELEECCDSRDAADSLRQVIREQLRPRGCAVEGAVVVEGDDGEIFAVVVRASRVSVKSIWPGGRTDVPAHPATPRPQPRSTSETLGVACPVIDLSSRRIARGRGA